jgi:hypothetical protein
MTELLLNQPFVLAQDAYEASDWAFEGTTNTQNTRPKASVQPTSMWQFWPVAT